MRVTSLLAYQIGGIFLLCALLMYGTLSGFVLRLRLGKPLAVLSAVALAIAGYYWFPQIYSIVTDSLPNRANTTGTPALNLAAPPTRPKSIQAAHAKAAVSPEATPVEHWKTITLDGSISSTAPANLPPVVSAHAKAAVSPESTPVEHGKTIALDHSTPSATPANLPTAVSATPADADADGNSPYDSKLKRGFKSIGRKLHLTPRSRY